MIKKLTITSLTALSLLLVTAQAEGVVKCQANKSGASTMKKMKHLKNKKMYKKNSPFLIKHGLPYITKMIMKSWDDTKLALSDEQKAKLMDVRKETIGSIMKIKPEVKALKKEIVSASKAGTKASELKSKVEKLASLKSQATMTHLNCIEKTRAILTPEQYTYLMKKRKAYKKSKK